MIFLLLPFVNQSLYVILFAIVLNGLYQVVWRKLAGVRPLVNRMLRLEERDGITEQLYRALPPRAELQGAVVRLVLEYPRDWEALIDEAALRAYTAECLEFRLVKYPQVETRIRLPADQAIASLSALELLDKYWQSAHTPKKDTDVLSKLAAQVIRSVEESTEV